MGDFLAALVGNPILFLVLLGCIFFALALLTTSSFTIKGITVPQLTRMQQVTSFMVGFVLFSMAFLIWNDGRGGIGGNGTSIPTSVSTPIAVGTSTSAPEVTIEPTAATSTITPTSTGCIVTVSNRLVSLMSDPDRFSQEIIRVPLGEYAVVEHRMVPFGSTQESWFQIEVEGRRGWIPNDTFSISAKTANCP